MVHNCCPAVCDPELILPPRNISVLLKLTYSSIHENYSNDISSMMSSCTERENEVNFFLVIVGLGGG